MMGEKEYKGFKNLIKQSKEKVDLVKFYYFNGLKLMK